MDRSDGQTTTTQHEYQDYLPSQDRRQAGADEPDVLLDAVVKAEELALEVEGLRARVWVQAEVADVVKLSVGADVNVHALDLAIKGVDVQAFFRVSLDEVQAILDKALTAVGEHPEHCWARSTLDKRDIVS